MQKRPSRRFGTKRVTGMVMTGRERESERTKEGKIDKNGCSEGKYKVRRVVVVAGTLSETSRPLLGADHGSRYLLWRSRSPLGHRNGGLPHEQQTASSQSNDVKFADKYRSYIPLQHPRRQPSEVLLPATMRSEVHPLDRWRSKVSAHDV